jgi:DNA polymerase-3 subunit epsilon
MSRLVVLDTETTGLEVAHGHRVIEIGCVELLERRPSGRHFHRYLNPERDIDAGAAQIHGLNADFLADKPRFADIAAEFIDFIDGTELVIHNAEFDVGFLDAELQRLDGHFGSIARHAQVIDTLSMARRLYPGQRNALDALCKRLGVDNSGRQLHGALLDAQLLADVYLAMTAGQASLELAFAALASPARAKSVPAAARSRKVLAADASEQSAHSAWLDLLDKECAGGSVWRRDGA